MTYSMCAGPRVVTDPELRDIIANLTKTGSKYCDPDFMPEEMEFTDLVNQRLAKGTGDCEM